MPSMSFFRMRAICSLYMAPSGVSGTFFSIDYLLSELRKTRSVFKTVHHVLDNLYAVAVLTGATDFPALDSVHRSTFALCGWRCKPTGLPADNNFNVSFGSFDG